MRPQRSERFAVEDHVVYNSEEDSTKQINGITFIVTNKVNRAVTNYITISNSYSAASVG